MKSIKQGIISQIFCRCLILFQIQPQWKQPILLSRFGAQTSILRILWINGALCQAVSLTQRRGNNLTIWWDIHVSKSVLRNHFFFQSQNRTLTRELEGKWKMPQAKRCRKFFLGNFSFAYYLAEKVFRK